jgi:ComF family protein
VPFEWARTFGPYEGQLARLIQLYKYGGERALARVLASLLHELLEANGLAQAIEGITFVPMSRKRQRERGFNQAELLARRLGQLTRKPVFSALRKVQETKPQEALSRAERLQNLKGAFAPHGQAHYESVLLVDDVYTTGATAWECAQALKEASYKRVYVLTVARTPAPSRQAQDQQRTEADNANAR